MEATIRLARIRGIEVGLHYSWFIVFIAFTLLLAEGQYPNLYPDWTRAEYFAVSIASVLLLFLSVLLHEFGHSIVAQQRGVPVRSITLFIFGGIAGLARDTDDSGDEFLIAIAGPIVSVVLAGVFGGLWLVFHTVNQQAGALLGYLAYINFALAVFNMIPGFPLDGGRVLRAVVWRATNDMRRATRIASSVGTGVGLLFVFGGILLVVAGALLNGLWLIVIGWFLQNAAAQSRQAVEQEHAFRNVTVGDLMNPVPVIVGPDVTLAELAEEYILRRNARGLPVVADGRMIGLVTVTDLKDVPRDSWSTTSVREVMTSNDQLQTVGPNGSITDALQLMSEHEFHQVPVVSNGRLVGILTRFELVRYMQTSQEIESGRR